MLDAIDWLGHASFRIEYDGKVIYIDPWEISDLSKSADIIFITHSHFDHFSPSDLLKITTQKTHLIAPDGCLGIPEVAQLIIVRPGDEKDVLGVKFKSVEAYNINGQFHPRSNAWVGYVIELGETTLYHSGDTDLIPEMDNLNVDIALLPITPPYTMSAQEAAEAAKRINAKVVIPMHYGKTTDSKDYVDILRKNLSGDIELKVCSSA
ncbi:MAG: MBL fold metallo-hydrolase [Candidatus Saelkia tenebricola]|nr:MBL fold metallo-hydrolase [Candidatus Saelkia tenebricola]